MTEAEAITSTESERRVEIYLREQVPPPVAETVETTVEQLRSLERDGTIAEVSVDSWGLRDVYAGDRSGTVEATIQEFEQWAERTGHSLRPAFERREVSSMFCEESVLRHDVPILSIAVYEGGRLQCVAPCADGDCTYTVRDCIEALAENDDATSERDVPLVRDPAPNAGQS